MVYQLWSIALLHPKNNRKPGGRIMVVKPWMLEKSARCHSCGDATVHDIQVDEYDLQISCRECGFKRYYTFTMVEVPEK